MGITQKIPKPLLTPSLPSPSPPPPPPHKPNPPMLYYSIVVVATATIVLAIYHLIIVRLCTIQYRRHLQQEAQLSRRRPNPEAPNATMPPLSGGGSTVCLASSFKYKKGAEGSRENELECSVCLSVFEEGEEVKRLPMCDHCFHASCIDMWLCSHIHCPLCRAPVLEPPPQPPPPGSSSI